jgi:hypothetical protein
LPRYEDKGRVAEDRIQMSPKNIEEKKKEKREEKP